MNTVLEKEDILVHAAEFIKGKLAGWLTKFFG